MKVKWIKEEVDNYNKIGLRAQWEMMINELENAKSLLEFGDVDTVYRITSGIAEFLYQDQDKTDHLREQIFKWRKLEDSNGN